MSHKNGSFSSSLGFVLACVGSAVGLGNIWMFPYRLGQYGGAAFLVPYIFFIVLFGLTGLSAEFAIGRRARTGRNWADHWLDSVNRIVRNRHRLFHYHRLGAPLSGRFSDGNDSEYRFSRIFFPGHRKLWKPSMASGSCADYSGDPADRFSGSD